MKTNARLLAAGLLLVLAAQPAQAATHYVDIRNPNPAPPYTDWTSAATNIQDAVEVAIPGETVLVTNGVYASGGRALRNFPLMTNRLVLDKTLTVISANGPAMTVIAGAEAPAGGNGDGAIRCAYVISNAVLSGFTLAKGHTRVSGDDYRDRSGGGVWCEPSGVVTNCTFIGNSSAYAGGGAYSGTLETCTLSANSANYGGGASSSTVQNCNLNGNSAYYGGGAEFSTLNNCILTGNSATSHGGGAFGSTLNNCVLAGNTANTGGGTDMGTLNNCTLCGNHASVDGGGVYESRLRNCIAYYNVAPIGPNFSDDLGVSYSCTTPLPAGPGNITANPGFVNLAGGNLRLNANSSCINAGSNAYAPGATDLSGGPRIAGGVVDMGAYEFQGAGLGESATLYVWPASPSPAAPYTNWATAARTIQDAVDAASAGDTVLVTNGFYATGGRAVFGEMTNRLAMDKPLTVVSINGPSVTVIAGAAAPGGGPGEGAIRGAYVGTFAMLSGFTLTNGHTRVFGDNEKEQSGGGAWCEESGCVTNSILSGNSARYHGGGSCSGILDSCTLAGNSAESGGGTFAGTLNNCTVSNNSARLAGAGTHSGRLNNCTLTGNSAGETGGGAFSGTLTNCTLSSNSTSRGGGAASSTLTKCTLTSNLAVFGAGASDSQLFNCGLIGNSAASDGGGAYYATLNDCTLVGNWTRISCGGACFGALTNCVVYYNSAPGSSNYYGSICAYSCTTPLPPGPGNITNEPAFIDLANGNLRLQTNSLCINAGNNAYAPGTTDLDGRPRIVGGRVDMGAYEFQGPGMGEFIGWLQHYGLPTDATADYTDPDNDGMNNWQEWVAYTNPTDALSYFRVQDISNGPPVGVQFTGFSNRLYTLKSCTNLSAPLWLDVPGQANVPGAGRPQSLVDTNPVPPSFYRVGVNLP